MCPTELGHDPGIAPCLRLLPIETRLQPQPLAEWRLVPEKWLQIDLDVDNPAQLADALQKVAEVRRVPVEHVRALGFWSDASPQDNLLVAADGRVQAPGMAQHAQDLEMIEQSHLQYLSLGNLIRLAQSDFSDRLVRALSSRLRTVFESARADVELWSQSACAQLDAQMRERRFGFTRRIEAIERIEQAASTLDERSAELEGQNLWFQGLQARLEALTAQLLGRESLPFAQPAPLAQTMVSAGAVLAEPA